MRFNTIHMQTIPRACVHMVARVMVLPHHLPQTVLQHGGQDLSALKGHWLPILAVEIRMLHDVASS